MTSGRCHAAVMVLLVTTVALALCEGRMAVSLDKADAGADVGGTEVRGMDFATKM